MNKILGIIVIGLLLSGSAYAAKFSANVGDVVENEVSFGKDKFPLPPGTFQVVLYKKWLDFRSVVLIQTDKNTGVTRWKIKLTATGSTDTKNSSWVPSKICDQKDSYFIKRIKGTPRFSCWLVSHATTEPEDVVRQSISNNYFSFGQTMLHKIRADQSLLSKTIDYEIANNIISPSMFVVSKHHYANKSKLYESEYYYNPYLDGLSESKELEWSRNEFHKRQIRKFPKHEAFFKKYISISASLVDRFNKLNKVKGNLELDASTYITQTSMNAGTGQTTNVFNTGSIVEQIKGLKELMDAGAISKEEFDKAKKKLLD